MRIKISPYMKDLTGQKFGKLTALYPTDSIGVNKGSIVWYCSCECGNYCEVDSKSLRNKNTQSCGCLKNKSKDITGQRFGRLVALELNTTYSKGKRYWLCQCDCGKKKLIYQYSLTSGKTISCGCYNKDKNFIDKENLIGKKFERLTILKYIPGTKIQKSKCQCQCDCGNIVEVLWNDLKRGTVKSCGCLQKELASSSNFKDISNQRFGKLIAICPETVKNGSYYWKCQCDCGSIVYINGASLRRGATLSCGCLSSKGEEKISSILTELNIDFIREKTFEDLLSSKNYPLYFDFYLPKYNCCIEFQGDQHYNQKNKWYSIDGVQRDNLKKEYCLKKNIILIEILYKELDLINKTYLLKLLNNYQIKI